MMISATFDNGMTVSRNTERKYSHAWIVVVDGKIVDKGFSASLSGASSAASATSPKDISARDKKDAKISMRHKKMAKDSNMTLKEWYADYSERVAKAADQRQIFIAEVA